MVIEKQYARRSLSDFMFNYEDPFSYQSMFDLGQDSFVKALVEVSTDSLGRDVRSYLQNPEAAIESMIEFAHTSFDPKAWKLAYVDGELAVMILPTFYWDAPEEGSLFHFGLTPKFRGKGFSVILHARGLLELKKMKLLRYVGSTDINNLGMIRVFIKNGCKLTSVLEQTIVDVGD